MTLINQAKGTLIDVYHHLLEDIGLISQEECQMAMADIEKPIPSGEIRVCYRVRPLDQGNNETVKQLGGGSER